jgi:hypothetical protein
MICMGNKRAPVKKWAVSLNPVYRRDRDERIKRAYELVLPLLAKAKPLTPNKETGKLQEREKERLIELYQTGVVELSEIEERLKGIRAKIRRLGEETKLLEKNEKEDAHRLQMIEQFDGFAKRMRSNLAELSFVERRQIVRLLVERVVVDTKTWEINIQHILPLNGNCRLRTGSGAALLPSGENAGELRRAASGVRPI